jgi:uroporphyrinogen decarboxylase
LNDRFLRACKLLPVDTTPVWFMRQAGRYLPQYRKIREKHDIVTIYKTPELCSEVTVQPVEALGVDAAIMFADIVLPLEGMGVRFQIKEGVGPVIEEPIRMLGGAQVLEDFDTKTDAPFILEAIELTKRRLDDRVPLIGFCGGPFTLASYLIEGGPAKDFIYTKKLMYNDSKTWELLMDKLAAAMTNYLRAQIQAGVDAIQLFDSWIGFLSPQDYRRYVLSYSQRIFKKLEGSGIPRIHFARGASNLLEEMKLAGGDVFSVDWTIPIDVAWQRLGHDVGIQGNLDPAVLLADIDLIKSEAADILKRVGRRVGHVFNLGHGILPQTSPEKVKELVKFVHGFNGESS